VDSGGSKKKDHSRVRLMIERERGYYKVFNKRRRGLLCVKNPGREGGNKNCAEKFVGGLFGGSISLADVAQKNNIDLQWPILLARASVQKSSPRQGCPHSGQSE